jgi:hypothetical protein
VGYTSSRARTPPAAPTVSLGHSGTLADDALEYLEAIVGELDRIRPRDRPRFALLMQDEANRQLGLKQFSWA